MRRYRGENIDQLYFEWLYSIIENSREVRPEKSFWLLAEQLHNKEFKFFVPNDDNRAADGKDLRDVFMAEQSVHGYLNGPCSMLEMLIAMAERMNFQVELFEEFETGVGEWFWILMRNIELHEFDDERYLDQDPRGYVDTVLEVVIERRYSHSGDGGLFPLDCALDDQRDVELWYQMSAWLMENTDF